MDLFLTHFTDVNPTELRWLEELYGCVEATARGAPLASSVGELALALLRCLQNVAGCQPPLMPLSYRFVTVSELVTRQHIPCCSHLTWSTSQYKQWSKEAEQLLPNHKVLQRANLLLTGYLTDRVCSGQSTSTCDGIWRVKDGSQTIRCKILNPSPDWLHKFMLFPDWNYIPQNASGHSPQIEGYLELSGSALPLNPDGGSYSPGRGLTDVMGVRGAARILQQRGRYNGARLQVCGQVSIVCPLLDIAGKSFFCFSLMEGDSTVSVLVSDVGHLCWRQCLTIGASVCMTELRVCTLRALEGRRVLCVTPQTHFIVPWLHLHSPVSHSNTEQEEMEASLELKRGTDLACGGHQPPGGPGAKTKVSKVISYKGVVSRVLDAEAGLFELDGKVGLCLAYQPQQDVGAGFRPGVEVEIHHVHFLYRASPRAPEALLCPCLRSSLCVTSFSRLEPQSMPGPTLGSPALLVLLQRNLGVSQYLWLCHSITALHDRLCPRWVRKERLGGVASRLLDCVLPTNPEGEGRKRNIYREMLEEPHYCPLVEYSVDSPKHELLSVQDVTLWMQEDCWTSLDLPSLLPPSAPHLTRAQLNPLLSWSVHVSTAWTQPRPMVLVGVLDTHGDGVCMQLTDQTGSLDCVAVESCDDQMCRAVCDTAWLGCLVCVQRFSLVVERFLKTDFPSWAHLGQRTYIRGRLCRVYIQVSVQDLQVLSPSSSMAVLLRAQQDQGVQERGQGTRPQGGHETRGCSEDTAVEGGTPGSSSTVRPSWTTGQAGRYRSTTSFKGAGAAQSRRAGEAEDSPCQGSSVSERGHSGAWSDHHASVVLRVESKQGLAFQNVHAASETPGRSLCFEACATLFGEPQQWAENPRNRPLEPRETEGVNACRQVDLQFLGRSIRWFPLLQVGCVYRLVVPQTQDPAVLRASCVPVKSGVLLHSAPCLLILVPWRFYTLPPTLRSTPLPQVSWPQKQALLSVSEVLYCSAASDLVSFEGLISHRISLEEGGKQPIVPATHRKSGTDVELCVNMRLTIQDIELPGQCVQVYLDLSQRPYVPGLLPGARVLFQFFQRKVSRSSSVYCRSVALSCVTVNALGQIECGLTAPCPPVPEVLLGDWVLGGAKCCVVGQVRVHVVCVLNLHMHWVCSLCGSVFKQDSCTRNHPPCSSSTGVFQADAKVAVEDGTGEAHVWFPSETVSALLALTSAEWEGLRRLVRVRGHIRIYSRGRNLESEVGSEDPLEQYLSYLCVSTSVCRQLALTCQLQKPQQSSTELRHELKRIPRGDREFVTRMSHPLQLSCTELSHWEPFV